MPVVIGLVCIGIIRLNKALAEREGKRSKQ